MNKISILININNIEHNKICNENLTLKIPRHFFFPQFHYIPIPLYSTFNNFNHDYIFMIILTQLGIRSKQYCFNSLIKLSSTFKDPRPDSPFWESILKLSSSYIHTWKQTTYITIHFIPLAILIKISHPSSYHPFRHSTKTETWGIVGSGEFLRIILADDNWLTKGNEEGRGGEEIAEKKPIRVRKIR